MPRKALKPCKHPGCPRLTEGAYCDEHSPCTQTDRLLPSVATEAGGSGSARRTCESIRYA